MAQDVPTSTPGPTTADGVEKAPLWKRAIPILVSLGILVYLFGYVLPQTIDYGAVFRAIGGIDAVEWGLLLIVAGVRLIPEGWIYVASQPGLRLGQGLSMFLVSNAMSMVAPGGLDLVSRFQMSRGWGFTPAEATSATIGSFVFSTFGRLSMPILAGLLLNLRRVRSDEMDFLAVLAFLIIAGAAGILYVILRSRDLAARVGTILGAFVSWAVGLFRKEVTTDFRALVLDFRSESSDLLKQRWHVGVLSGFVAQLATFLVLLASVRFVGVSNDQLEFTLILAAFAAVAALTSIPFLGIPGIAEAIYIGALNLAAGGGSADELAAAVFVFRMLTWLAPVPIGGIAYSRWKSEASGGPSVPEGA